MQTTLCRHARAERPGCPREQTNVTGVKFHPGATLQAARQHHGSIANSNQTTHRMTNRLKHTPHLPVSPFRNGDAVPAIGAFAAAFIDRTEMGRAIADVDT
jgi:hypothetical protein